MKAQFEVSEEVWGRVKVASMLACKSIGEMLEPVLDKAFPGRREVVEVDTRGRAPGERSLRVVEADASKPVQVSNPALPTIPMGKCRKCFESFPVADLITEPKTGKLFCADCVENMKNGQ